jgi:hypothetical protein
MNNTNTGGPAYPAPTTKPLENYYPGISIRDYFAAKAMHALVNRILSNSELGRTAYEIADEMLRAREAK